MKESFMASHGHRALEEDVNLNWEPSAENLWDTSTDCFERGLSMSGDGKTFAITCKEDNSNTGMVKVYSLVDGQWTQKGQDIVGQQGNEQLGNSVALSGEGSILAIGIYQRSTGSKSNNGCIEVYKYDGNGWTLMGEQIEGQNAKEYFGEKVSLSADGHILAGSGNLSSGNGYKGSVRTFQFVEEDWKLLGSEISGQSDYDNLGNSLSLPDNGQVMAIGSKGTDDGFTDSGSFSVYQYVNNGWYKMGDTINGDTSNSGLGTSMQISRDASTVIVGSYWGKCAIVYRYNENENQWKQIGEKLSPTTDVFGVGNVVSISKDGSIILLPSPEENSRKGMVRAYKYSGSQWDQLGQDIYGDGDYNYENFGNPAVLSGDGNTLVAAGRKSGASVYTLPVVEEWDGNWYITYDTANLADGVLTSTYITKPGVDASANVTVAHTDGTCASEGETHDKSVITATASTVTVVDDTIDDTLDVAKTLDAAVIASSHNGTFLFCETVTLTNSGLNIVDVQTEYTVKANFLATIGTYNITLEDDSLVTTVVSLFCLFFM